MCSFTDKDEGYATNQVQVAKDLYEALRQFFLVFTEVQQSDFYITGESYAGIIIIASIHHIWTAHACGDSEDIRIWLIPGKYVPAISYKIHKMNQDPANVRINLKGLAIGDGLTDPIHQMNYGDFLFQTGLGMLVA